MNLDELRTVQSKERQKDSLQHLRPSFYREVGEYIAELKAERDRVAAEADDPFSEPEVGRLTDEIETAKDVVEAVYERRMGKLVKQASLAAAGMPADDEGLTAEERDLFEDLVDRIESNKSHVLDVLEGGAEDDATASPDATSTADASRSTPNETSVGDDPTGSAAGPDAKAAGSEREPPVPPTEAPEAGGDRSAGGDEGGPVTGEDDGVSAADVMGGETPSNPTPDASSGAEGAAESDGSDAGSGTAERSGDGSDAGPAGSRTDDEESEPSPDGGDPRPDVDRVTVRITRDVGSILGIDDREYTLASDDVVTLPEQNAEPLVERDAAEPLE